MPFTLMAGYTRYEGKSFSIKAFHFFFKKIQKKFIFFLTKEKIVVLLQRTN
jgi:hypothetical protein